MDALISSGSFKCVEDANGKHIQCVTDGYFSFEQPHAYGTWTFDWYMKDLGYLSLVSDRRASLPYNGYTIKIEGTNIRLQRYLTGLLFTRIDVSDVVNINQWNSIKLTRTANSDFKLYTNGNLVGSVTDNEVFTSAFAVFDMDAGDKVKSFKHFQGVEA